MKKIITVLLCVVMLLGVLSFSSFAVDELTEAPQTTNVPETTKTVQTTEFVLEVDVNKRYTNFADETQADEIQEQENEKIDGRKTLYIAVLCAALAVSVVVLAVSLKRVPKEEDIDISGQNKVKKKKEKADKKDKEE